MANARVNEWSTTAASNTDINGNNIAEGCLPGGINNAIREAMRQIRLEVASQGADIASAATTDIGAATGQYVKITGTTTITGLGTVNAGTMRWVQFDGALTLTHNAASLILPSSANITTAQGDIACMVSLGAGNWKCLHYQRVDGRPVVSGTVGKHKIFIPAQGMSAYPGSAVAYTEQLGTDVAYASWDFDQTSVEAIYFQISMPSSWNEGTITFVPIWTAAAGTGGVVWTMFAVARSNDDAIGGSFSANVSSTDTLIATGDLHRGPESSALTIDGTPAANDTVFFFLRRTPTDASDTLTADAKLLGVELYITTDAAVDVA